MDYRWYFPFPILIYHMIILEISLWEMVNINGHTYYEYYGKWYILMVNSKYYQYRIIEISYWFLSCQAWQRTPRGREGLPTMVPRGMGPRRRTSWWIIVDVFILGSIWGEFLRNPEYINYSICAYIYIQIWTTWYTVDYIICLHPAFHGLGFSQLYYMVVGISKYRPCTMLPV
jgi:hypothetical protein